jgi:hypothetical protein
MIVTARYYGFFSTVTKKLYEEIDVTEGINVKDLIEVLARGHGYSSLGSASSGPCTAIRTL